MSLLDDAKNILGGGSDLVGNVVNSVTGTLTEKLADFVDLDKLDLSQVTGLIEKFGLEDKIPADVMSALKDGKLSEDELKPFITKAIEAIKGQANNASSAVDSAADAVKEATE